MATLNKSTSTSKKLKETGAKYSVTDRSGNTKFFSSSKDADRGKEPIATSQRGSTKVTPVSTLNSQNIKQNTPIILPTPQVGDNLKGMTDMINAGLGVGAKSTSTTPTTPESNSFQNISAYLKSNADLYGEMGTGEDRLADIERDAKLKQKEKLVSSLQGQIGTITSNRDAQILSLEGQGRGQTSSFIGGEQARISREAAIQAMPLQAQLAAAQDDLESARSYVDRMFAIQTQDAQNRYNFQKEVNSTIFGYLNEQEKRALAVKEREEDRAYDREKMNIQRMTDFAKQAFEYGQAGLGASFLSLDPQSETFEQVFAQHARGLVKPVPPTSTKTIVETEKAEKRLEDQVTKAETVLGSVQEAIGQANNLSAGFLGGLSYKVPGTPAYDLTKTIDTIKSNIGFDTLQAMREASPTGGALGQVAVQELEMLQAVLGSLDVGQSPTQLKENLMDVETHYVNWLHTVGFELAPDGNVVQIID